MSILSSINKYTKIASIFLIASKLLFIPTVISILTRHQETSRLFLALYIFSTISSILFSLYGSYTMSSAKKEKKFKDSDNGTFLIKVKKGKIIEVLENI